MVRLAKIFHERQPFVGYITGGDGGMEYNIACALAMLEGGVDILEVGFPFSDPVADGPVIERAHKRSLEQGTTSSSILEIARCLRKSTEAPLVLFSYFNPLLQKGERYLHELKTAGYDAVLIVDLALPERPTSEPFFQALKRAELVPIVLVTPSTYEDRLIAIAKFADGFIYYVLQKGTTGHRTQLPEDFSLQLERIRRHAQMPIVAGFGIADQTSARQVLTCANGFVVGSAFVQLMEKRANPNELKFLAQSIDPRQKVKH